MIGIYGRATDYLLTHGKAQTMRNKVTLAGELGTILTTNLPSTSRAFGSHTSTLPRSLPHFHLPPPYLLTIIIFTSGISQPLCVILLISDLLTYRLNTRTSRTRPTDTEWNKRVELSSVHWLIVIVVLINCISFFRTYLRLYIESACCDQCRNDSDSDCSY